MEKKVRENKVKVGGEKWMVFPAYNRWEEKYMYVPFQLLRSAIGKYRRQKSENPTKDFVIKIVGFFGPTHGWSRCWKLLHNRYSYVWTAEGQYIPKHLLQEATIVLRINPRTENFFISCEGNDEACYCSENSFLNKLYSDSLSEV